MEKDPTWFREALTEAGIELTGARLAMLGLMERCLDRLDPEALAIQAGIGRATVYRLFRLLEQQGLLCRVAEANGGRFYHATRAATGKHLQCVSCGRVEDLDPAHIEGILKLAPATVGFSVLDYHIEMHGICAACKRQLELPNESSEWASRGTTRVEDSQEYQTATC